MNMQIKFDIFLSDTILCKENLKDTQYSLHKWNSNSQKCSIQIIF